jgi:hypothetical protein
MQNELAAGGDSLGIRILGINETGQESGNGSIVAGRSIPWLQDTAGENVWGSWHVVYRDVYVLDAANEVVGVFNLTEHDLGEAADYAALQALLLRAGENGR